MVFNIGDRVRFKDDATNHHWSIVNIYPSISKVQVLSSDGNISKVVEPLLLVPYDPVSEIKQAIREALLSDEFLEAFAAAWVKTPILHESELNLIVADETRPYKSWNEIAEEAWQPVATAEVSSDATLEPITGSESEAYYLNKLKNGGSK